MPKRTAYIPAFKILARACAGAGVGAIWADFLREPMSVSTAIIASAVRV